MSGDEGLEDRLEMPVGELELSSRAMACLAQANIETLGDLVRYHPDELLALPSLSRRVLTEIQRAIEDLGLEFGMPPGDHS